MRRVAGVAGALLLLLLLLLLAASLASAQPPAADRLLDDFHDPAAWTLLASDDVQAHLRVTPGGQGATPALCIDFDFGRVTGYVAARRRLPIDWPEHFELRLSAGGAVAGNDLQLKFVDAVGADVWWARRPAFGSGQGLTPAGAALTPGLPELRWRQRQVEFAWGPTSDRRLTRTESVELVVASSASGGRRGSACFDRLGLVALPALPEAPAAPVAQAGSALDQHPAAAAIDADPASDWRPAASAGAAAVLTIDYGRPRDLSLLTLRWREGAAARRYRIALSEDGAHWRDARAVDGARGALQRHFLPDAEARFLQIAVDEPVPRPVALAEVELGDAATADAFFARLAADAPRGHYPRAYRGEQPYWTVFGVDGGPVASLLGEDGAVEPVPGVGAVEPFVQVDGRVLGWADAVGRQTLRQGDLPMPSVHWRVDRGRLALDIDAFAMPAAAAATARRTALVTTTALATMAGTVATGTGTTGTGTTKTTTATTASAAVAVPNAPPGAQAIVRYRLRNLSRQPRSLTLALAWRPFQVNPPTQFLAHPGGASRIGRLTWTGQALQVDGVDRLQPLTLPASVRLEPLAAGPVPEWLGDADADTDANAEKMAPIAPPAASDIADPAGYPSAALRFPMRLRPGEQREVLVALPVAGVPAVPSLAGVVAAERRAVTAWRERLDRVRLTGPAEVGDIAETLRAALGQVLINRSGPALQPGARSYARSWIRDGALTSSALLRLGQDDVARDFLLWYAPFQFASGKIPCCATVRGADPVPENDSDGEFLFAASELWRYTRDRPTAERLWPHARAAAEHLETLRQSERRADNLTQDRRAYYGLMPPSISHEGYSDRPAYSYWDDFWAATGYRSAAALADALGHPEDARRLAVQHGEFMADLLASLAASTERHHLDLIPGAADRGDVDPTSSSIALSPGDLLGTLPQGLVRHTFDRYWHDFSERRDAANPAWDAYTPYEWRNVGAFVRLGERERALQAMAYFYRDRRPAGWHQWAEVVGREPRAPRFIGDMPHGWVASDQIRAVLDVFAFEDAAADRLVLAAGVPLAWFTGRGLSVTDLRTPWGRLGWRGRSHPTPTGRQVIDIDIARLRERPAGGIELRGPWPAASRVSIDGRPVAGPADRIRLPKTPARVRLVLPDT